MVQVTGPLNVPENKVALLLSVTVNEPPAAKVPPVCSDPLSKEPVWKLTEPKFEPVTSPEPLLMAISVEPFSESPLLEPARVPPLFV